MKKAVFALPLLLAACAGTSTPPKPAQDNRSEVERYFPLIDGHIYTYEVTRSDVATQDMFMLRVRRSSPTTAELRTGDTSKVLTISASSIARDTGGFVLKSPLVQGAKWDGDNGASTQIVAVGVSVKVPAGSFANCLKTIQTGASGGETVTTVFCPNVGIVEMSAEKATSTTAVSEHVKLRAFGPPVNLK